MSVVFRADGVPLASRVDYWREIISDVFLPLDLRGEAGPDSAAELRTAEIGPIRLSESVTGPGSSFLTGRTPRLIRSSDPDICLVGVLVEGELRVAQDGRRAVLRPGDLSFTDPGRPFEHSFTAVRNIRLSVPKAMIGLRDRELGELTGVRIPGDRGAGALASALAPQLAHSVDELPASEVARLGTAVVDVLAVALAGRLGRASAVPGARERTLLHRVYGLIEQQLADPGLSPRSIAAALHISLRYLYRLFEAEPVTVSDWIRRRRLQRCRQDLRDPAQRNRPVAAIGAHWGFLSASHFSRVFRDAYRVSPAEFRGTDRQ
ncbi:MAG: helix-turn-helix domain-containing protein [Nocardiopsaceae bacterium]|nr:helix-turn-helix domain-containing protein [Nocardiopsaceae bacterium]